MSTTDIVEEVVEEGAKLASTAIYVDKRALIVGSIFGGLVAAAAVYGAYRYGVKETTAKYEEILKQEIAEAKAFYKLANKQGEFATPEQAVASLHPLPETELEEAVVALNKYQGRSDEEERSVNIFTERTPEDDNFDLEEEMENRSPNSPYVISSDEFMEAEEGYDQITITYYAGDDTLADDKEQEIPNVDLIIGEGNLERFGHGSGDTRIVYIRNDRMQTDFEVLKSDGKYAHEVLGFEHSDGGSRARRLKNQPRKFRGEDT